MKRVVLCLNIESNTIEDFKYFIENYLPNDCFIDLVHIYKTHVYMNELSPYVYPDDEQRGEIEKVIDQYLTNFSNNLSELKPEVQIEKHVYFHENPKVHICDYLKNNRADLAVVATRGKYGFEGLFTSSFAEYLNRHSPSDLYIIRPK